MRTKEAIVCDCGHAGFIVLSENDAPYSANWERYELEGFDTAASDRAAPRGSIARMNPKCPKCGKTGKVRHA
jgi:hypothetical protein